MEDLLLSRQARQPGGVPANNLRATAARRRSHSPDAGRLLLILLARCLCCCCCRRRRSSQILLWPSADATATQRVDLRSKLRLPPYGFGSEESYAQLETTFGLCCLDGRSLCSAAACLFGSGCLGDGSPPDSACRFDVGLARGRAGLDAYLGLDSIDARRHRRSIKNLANRCADPQLRVRRLKPRCAPHAPMS